MVSVFVHTFAKFNSDKPFKIDRKNESFSAMLKVGSEVGFDVFLARYDLYNKRSKRLKKAWVYDDGWKIVKNKKVDLCYYHGKTRGIYKEIKKLKKFINIPFYNNLDLEVVCDDKLLTYSIFSEFMPKTFLINDHFGLMRVLNFIDTDYVVLKPRFGSYGKGVMILKKKNLRNGILKDTIAQEFIDSSEGILNVRKLHDLRLIIVDGKIDHAYIRIPKARSFVSNSALGGSKVYVENSEIPSCFKRMARKIDNSLKFYGPRIYSADFSLENNRKPWLIELNSKPGMMYYGGYEDKRERFFINVFNSIKNII